MPHRPYDRKCRFCGATGYQPLVVKYDSERRLYTIAQSSKDVCTVCAGTKHVPIFYDPPEDYTVMCSICAGSSWQLKSASKGDATKGQEYGTVVGPCLMCHGLGFSLRSGKDPRVPYDEVAPAVSTNGAVKPLFPRK